MTNYDRYAIIVLAIGIMNQIVSSSKFDFYAASSVIIAIILFIISAVKCKKDD